MYWLTGSMETYTMIQLRLAAKDNDVPVVWWDKNLEPWPHVNERHRMKAELKAIFLGIHPKLRAKPKRKSPPQVSDNWPVTDDEKK